MNPMRGVRGFPRLRPRRISYRANLDESSQERQTDTRNKPRGNAWSVGAGELESWETRARGNGQSQIGHSEPRRRVEAGSPDQTR
jgi:hypothetical protein